MIQEQATAALIIALISEKNKSKEKGKKEESVWNLYLKGKKNLEFYETACRTAFRFAILHSQTSWIMKVVSYKSFNVRAASHFTFLYLFARLISK